MIIEIYGSDRVQVPKPSRWHRMTSARLLWPSVAQMTLILKACLPFFKHIEMGDSTGNTRLELELYLGSSDCASIVCTVRYCEVHQQLEKDEIEGPHEIDQEHVGNTSSLSSLKKTTTYHMKMARNLHQPTTSRVSCWTSPLHPSVPKVSLRISSVT